MFRRERWLRRERELLSVCFLRQKLTSFTLLIKRPHVGFLARVPDEPHLKHCM